MYHHSPPANSKHSHPINACCVCHLWWMLRACVTVREREIDEFDGLLWVPAIFSVRSKTRRKKKEGARDKGTEEGHMKAISVETAWVHRWKRRDRDRENEWIWVKVKWLNPPLLLCRLVPPHPLLVLSSFISYSILFCSLIFLLISSYLPFSKCLLFSLFPCPFCLFSSHCLTCLSLITACFIISPYLSSHLFLSSPLLSPSLLYSSFPFIWPCLSFPYLFLYLFSPLHYFPHLISISSQLFSPVLFSPLFIVPFLVSSHVFTAHLSPHLLLFLLSHPFLFFVSCLIVSPLFHLGLSCSLSSPPLVSSRVLVWSSCYSFPNLSSTLFSSSFLLSSISLSLCLLSCPLFVSSFVSPFLICPLLVPPHLHICLSFFSPLSCPLLVSSHLFFLLS